MDQFWGARSVEQGKDYLSIYNKNISDDERTRFKDLTETSQLRRYLRGIVLIAAYLNPKQDKKNFSKFISERFDIEHILPKKWNNYDGWTDLSWEKHLNLIGNLVPLSKALNIAARNEFFDKKKRQYAESLVQDVRDLVDEPEWKPAVLLQKHKEKLARLWDYFESPSVL